MKKQTVVIGITSGIAAYKILDLIKLLKKTGTNVEVIMTLAATQMIAPNEFEKVLGKKVYTTLFEDDFDYREVLTTREVDHIKLADRADVFVVAPATANIIAKLAHAVADDFLTTTILATKAPILICPSMNVNMWLNPLVQENLKKLRSQSFQILPPDKGMLACGYEGVGRLADIANINKEIDLLLRKRKTLAGKRVLVTAGGTIEPIDDVRFITNKSSGKMGAAIAEECFLRGAGVLLLRARSAVSTRFQIKEEAFETSADLAQLLARYVSKFDIIFQTAAVSDFGLTNKYRGKIDSQKSLRLDLVPLPKLIHQINKLNPRIKLIAFKAVYNLSQKEMIRVAKQKLIQSHAQAVVVNDVSKKDRGFMADTNEVILVRKTNPAVKIPLASKRQIAQKLLDNLAGSM